MKRLSRKQIGNLGLYEFQGYIGAMNHPTFGGWEGTERFSKLLQLSEGADWKILEIGVSTGYIACHYATRYSCHITGIDLSAILIEIANKRKTKLGLKNVEFLQSNAMELPFEDNKFDVVYGEAVTALLPDVNKGLKEYLRVVKTGGRIGTLDLFARDDLDDQIAMEINTIMSVVIGAKIEIRRLAQWKEIFENLGIQNIQVHEFYENQFIRSQKRIEMIKILSKMLYHIMVNKAVRQKVMPTLPLAKKMMDSNFISNFGYLIFTGEK
ncbi:MAG: class I SAM-dependent methyltransferase [Candidatus Hodarchaeales archaeon]|jgi:ubiquinone/menaquinone biosynthesis C-methylase UbiE